LLTLTTPCVCIIVDIFINEVYSPPGFKIQSDDVVIDLGAHQGVFSAYAAEKTKQVVIAYEPEISNFTKLCKFLKKNNIENVRAYNFAVSGNGSDRYLRKMNSSSTHNLVEISLQQELPLEQYQCVQTKSLDQVIDHIDHVDLLKVDIEGAEVELFVGASRETLKKIARISAETHFSPDDSRLDILLRTLKQEFDNISFIPLSGKNLGYIYAQKQEK